MCARTFLLSLFLLAAPVAAQVAPQKGEIALDGVVASIASDGASFGLETAAFTLPNGKTAVLKTPKIKVVSLSANVAIFPRGDAIWKLPKAEIRVGLAARVIGKDAGIGKSLPARQVELVREIGGKRLDYFVSQKGSDAAQGTFDAPWRTIQGAVKRVSSGSSEAAPNVLHIGVGEFNESFDGQNAGLLIEEKNNLILTGTGAQATGGSQITTRDYIKRRSGVVRVSRAQNITFCNLIIGDDQNWEGEAFFEATLHLEAGASVALRAVRLRGPTKETLLDGDKKRAPTAIRAGNGDNIAQDSTCSARLENVLVTGHGAFLSNPAGQVWCERVTIARSFGINADDVLLFMQTPHEVLPDAKRYTFKNCVFYEIEGHDKGRHVWFTAGEEGQDKVFFDPEGGGNWVVRCHREGPNDLYNEKNLADGFPMRSARGWVRAQGVWQDGDPNAKALGGLCVDNDLQLVRRDDFPFLSPPDFAGGWTGGFWTPQSASKGD